MPASSEELGVSTIVSLSKRVCISRSCENNPSNILEFAMPNSPNGVDSKINGFGRDDAGEIYVIGSENGLLTGNTGKVQKIVPALPPGC